MARSNVNAVVRLEINDHSWVHIQIVANIALKLLRQLTKHGMEPSLVRDYGMETEDAEVVVVLAALTHCVGMSVHRKGHEDWSLFLSEPKLRELLDGIYDEPDRTVVVSEVLQAITSHRADGEPLSLEAGILRVADALDMAKGRSRIPFERGHVSMHSLSAAAVEEVLIGDGEVKPVRIEIVMNNSSGLFQVDGLLRAKLRGSGLEPHVEVIAHIDTGRSARLRVRLESELDAGSVCVSGRACTKQRGQLGRRAGCIRLDVDRDGRDAPREGPHPRVRIARVKPLGAGGTGTIGPRPAGSSNGRTPDSGSGSWGSSPCPAASETPRKGRFALFESKTLVTVLVKLS